MTGQSFSQEPETALAWFLPGTAIVRLEPLGQGNINDSWRVELAGGRRLVLQRLHPEVFIDPGMVMVNVRTVTEHLNRICSPGIAFFRLVCTPQGHDHCFDSAEKVLAAFDPY